LAYKPDFPDYPDVTFPSLGRIDDPRDTVMNTIVDFTRDGYAPFPLSQQPAQRLEDMSYLQRLLLPLRLRIVGRKLAHKAHKGLCVTTEDIQNRFTRLDAMDLGALDDTKTQLLFSWAFDIDLKKDDWDALFYHLAGPSSVLAKRDVILSFIDSLTQRRSHRLPSVATCLHAMAHSLRRITKQVLATRFVFDHNSNFANIWEIIKCTAALYMFLSVPYQIAFLRHGLLTTYFTSLSISWAFDALFVIDVFLKFNRSFVDERSIEVSG